MTSSRRLSGWYFRLAQSLEAGVPLLEALGGPGEPAARERAALVGRLTQGARLGDELLATQQWLPAADARQLKAGAEAGRLPATCRRLAAQHEELARLRVRATLATLYPTAVLHLGAVLVPLRHLVLGSPATYGREVVLVLGPLWLVLGAAWWVRARHPRLLRPVLARLPWISGYQKARDLGVLATVLEGYAACGVSPVVAWAQAGLATGAPALEALGQRMAAEAQAGRPPGVALARETVLPIEFTHAYRSGEQSGKLDESLAWLGRRYAEQAQQKLTQASLWYPQFALLLVALWVGKVVITIYAGYLQQLLSVME